MDLNGTVPLRTTTVDLEPTTTTKTTTHTTTVEPSYAYHYGFGSDFYRRLVDARNITNGYWEFGYAVLSIVLGSMIGLGFLLLTTALPISMIAIGATHLENCPAAPEIPILLITAGCILTFGSLCNIIDQLLEGYVYHTSGKRQSKLITLVNIIVLGLVLASLILGSIWVYGRNRPADVQQPGNYYSYCHPTVWQFAFWVLNVSWIAVGLIVGLTLIGIVTAYSIN